MRVAIGASTRFLKDATKMEWDEHFSSWLEVTRRPGPAAHLRLEAARRRVRTNTLADWQWLVAALADPARKVFVALVFKLQPVPKKLLRPFLHAAVLERNPSLNRIFVEPCVRSWGGGEINRCLLGYLQNGSNEEKAGAASAFYWAQGNPRNEDLRELRNSIRSALLSEFVSNDDVSIRRRILPLLRLDTSAYPIEEHALIAEAIALARAHPDEYIRHRIEIQFGAGGHSSQFLALGLTAPNPSSERMSNSGFACCRAPLMSNVIQ